METSILVQGETAVKTTMRKGREGWEMRSTMAAPELAPYGGRLHTEGHPEMEISTSKDSRGMLTTCASAAWCHAGMKTFVIFGDFMVWPIREKARGTEANIRAQHEKGLAMLGSLKARALEFYRAKGAE